MKSPNPRIALVLAAVIAIMLVVVIRLTNTQEPKGNPVDSQPAVAQTMPAVTQKQAKEDQQPTAPAASTAEAPAPSALSRSSQMVLKIWVDPFKEGAQRDLDRLCLNVPSLSKEQKLALTTAIDEKLTTRTKAIEQILESMNLQRVMNSGFSSDEKKQLASAIPREALLDDGTLAAVLNDQQYGEYTKAKEARRISDAEDLASAVMRDVGKYVDLSPDQKDLLFKKLTTNELDPASQPELPPGEDPRTAIVRSIFTADQAAVYEKAKDAEKKAVEKMIETLGEAP